MTQPPEYPAYPGPEQPMPPRGYQPPPPPRYQSPPQQPYGAMPQGAPWGAYAGWWSRVGASILDSLIGFVVAIVPIVAGLYLAFKDTDQDPITGELIGRVEPIGIVVMVLGYVLIFAFQIWNAVFRQGRTGQTLGKQIVGIEVIREDTGQFLGAGKAFLRWLMAAILGGLCFLDYLWPLWDKKKQTWHDMIVGSVVVKK